MPSLRLRLASSWLPEWSLKGHLENVSELTTGALETLLADRAPTTAAKLHSSMKPLVGNLSECRAAMAWNHNALVQSLVEEIGEKEAFNLGRESLFKVGLRIGEETRSVLGVGDDIDDLIMAARALYKVLGISFMVERRGDGLEIVVRRCALSNYYSERACMLLSAVDEGVIRGLNPRVGMKFERMITSGFPTCIARVWVEPGGAPA